MSDPSLPIQKAVVGALQASAALKALIGDPPRVFDRVPPGAAVPYITYDQDQVLVDRGDADGEACDNGAEVYVTLSSWSRDVGRVEAKRIASAAADVLDAAIAVEGHEIVTHDVQVQSQPTDPDGLTSRSLIVAYYQTKPAA